MRYNVAQLLKEQNGHTRHYTLHEDISALDPEIAPLSALDGAIQPVRGVLPIAAAARRFWSAALV